MIVHCSTETLLTVPHAPHHINVFFQAINVPKQFSAGGAYDAPPDPVIGWRGEYIPSPFPLKFSCIERGPMHQRGGPRAKKWIDGSMRTARNFPYSSHKFLTTSVHKRRL